MPSAHTPRDDEEVKESEKWDIRQTRKPLKVLIKHRRYRDSIISAIHPKNEA